MLHRGIFSRRLAHDNPTELCMFFREFITFLPFLDKNLELLTRDEHSYAIYACL
jgi:hypothetical protein